MEGRGEEWRAPGGEDADILLAKGKGEGDRSMKALVEVWVGEGGVLESGSSSLFLEDLSLLEEKGERDLEEKEERGKEEH